MGVLITLCKCRVSKKYKAENQIWILKTLIDISTKK